jgi:hypothetical protein
MEAIAMHGPGMLAPLPDIIRWLDKHDEVTKLNRHLSEKTGPVTSYDTKLHREWFKLMKHSPVYTWDNTILQPLGQHRSGWNGVLYTPDGHRVEQGWVACEQCEGGKHWRRAL